MTSSWSIFKLLYLLLITQYQQNFGGNNFTFLTPTPTPSGLFARYKAVRKKGDVRFAWQRLHGKITKLVLSEFFIILLQSTKLDTFKK